MILAFFESIKYVGHLFPLALLRVYLGYYFLMSALEKLEGDFLLQPSLAATITEWLPKSAAPNWYKDLVDQLVIPNWKIFAYIVVYCHLIIGISYIAGFFVRPVSLIGAFLTLNFIFNSGPEMANLHQTHLAVFILMAWVGAGRCLGFDYFFYKRDRGIWW